VPASTSSTQKASHPAIHPLLRWAGSKRTLLPRLLGRLPGEFGRYIEPFAGSACLFFALRPSRAVLADLNPELIAAYQALAVDPSAVAERVTRWPATSDSYYRVRATDPSTLDLATRAARFIYLNRLCFNGVYRTNRRGEFNVPFGSRTGAMPDADHLVACGEALAEADLCCADFEAVLDSARADDFVYLDPPYSRALSDAYGVYGYGSFQGTDIERLIESLRRLDAKGAKVLVSYRASASLERLGSPWYAEQVSVTTQVGGTSASRSTRRELLLANYPAPDRTR
jgi:DNA adenine methylase